VTFSESKFFTGEAFSCVRVLTLDDSYGRTISMPSDVETDLRLFTDAEPTSAIALPHLTMRHQVDYGGAA
jgi:hypothetical protein